MSGGLRWDGPHVPAPRAAPECLTPMLRRSGAAQAQRDPARCVCNAPMTKQATVLFTMAWGALALTGVSILVFGLIATVWGGASDPPFLRALGMASMGMGLFGVMITVSAYRRRARWAWWTLWY